MSLQELQVLLQSISSFAIAGGLIYAAVQFRHARRAAHVANFTRMVELQMHLREMRVHDPVLAQVYKHDVAQLADARAIREYFFNLMQLSVYEIVWFSHRMGQIPADYYRSWEKRVRDIAQEESFRNMLRNPSMKIMHDDFQRYIERLVGDLEARR
ncbi:MAG TPA: hypothetical protein VK081_02430 [Planctomycetota bacterium]|nr:hypothetical protein [Planctomycetota bacterium]